METCHYGKHVDLETGHSGSRIFISGLSWIYVVLQFSCVNLVGVQFGFVLLYLHFEYEYHFSCTNVGSSLQVCSSLGQI